MIDTTNFDVVARLRELAEADLRELARDIPVMGLTIDADELRRWADAMDAAADELTRLRTLLSSSRGEQGWRDDIKAAPHGKKVIVRAKGDFQGERTMMARFYPKHTLEAPDGYGASDGFDEDEYGDVFAPEGWYEDMEAEEPPLHNIEPTHWMPLPSAPGSVPTSLAGQLPDGKALKRGDRIIRNGQLLEFIESEIEGDKFIVIGAAPQPTAGGDAPTDRASPIQPYGPDAALLKAHHGGMKDAG